MRRDEEANLPTGRRTKMRLNWGKTGRVSGAVFGEQDGDGVRRSGAVRTTTTAYSHATRTRREAKMKVPSGKYMMSPSAHEVGRICMARCAVLSLRLRPLAAADPPSARPVKVDIQN
ncbi:hypothetical protein I7I51_01958 [Histoplasma capsulatum]|uniref:Uncharacterized protein n=1 Tax=Ajellomyces capsulatus TaxID=5037 RepID=A0A8A1MJN7_AJECA|nr:hypothetical protein I7I51_01958 [Histoplasma capsulatum]